MPSSHRRYADWTIERIRREAASIGPATTVLCELILERRPHPEQGFRACLGIVRLARPFGADRLEGPATRAIEISTLTYGSVRSILDNKLDRQAAQRPPANDGRSSTPISADLATTTEEKAVAYPSNARPIGPAWPFRHGPGVCRARSLRRNRRAHPCRLARPSCSTVSSPIAVTSGWPPRCAMPDCASRPVSRTSITEPHGVSTAFCFRG